MLVLIAIGTPSIQTDYDAGWDWGSRAGTFDACNGHVIRDFSGVAQSDYNAGYVDGYCNAFAAFC